MAVAIQYRDGRGGYCTYYPRSMSEVERRLRWLRGRRYEAAVYRGNRQVGSVQADSAAPGGWTWWCESDLYDGNE